MPLLQKLSNNPAVGPLKRLLRRIARHWPLPVLAKTREGLSLYVDLRSAIGQGILVTGEFDPRVFDPISEVLLPGDTFLDVGSNVGYYTTMAARCVGASGSVHAVEIDPRPLRCLRRTLERPEYDNVRLHEVAAGEAEGEFLFSLGSDCGHSRLDDKNGTRRVPVCTLDKLIEVPQGKTLRAIKIDIEGGELSALRGAHSIISIHHPLLVIECDDVLQAAFGYTTADLTDFLDKLGYTYAWLDGTHSPTLVAR